MVRAKYKEDWRKKPPQSKDTGGLNVFTKRFSIILLLVFMLASGASYFLRPPAVEVKEELFEEFSVYVRILSGIQSPKMENVSRELEVNENIKVFTLNQDIKRGFIRFLPSTLITSEKPNGEEVKYKEIGYSKNGQELEVEGSSQSGIFRTFSLGKSTDPLLEKNAIHTFKFKYKTESLDFNHEDANTLIEKLIFPITTKILTKNFSFAVELPKKKLTGDISGSYRIVAEDWLWEKAKISKPEPLEVKQIEDRTVLAGAIKDVVLPGQTILLEIVF